MKMNKSVDYEKLPVEDLCKRAEDGDARAQGVLGRKYARGDGVGVDMEQGVKWGKSAAEQGDYRGQALLGYCYMNGVVLNRDYSQSLRWYLLSAEQGYCPAIYSIGTIYEKGYGVTPNIEKAKIWYLRGAKKGYGYCQVALGYLYEKLENSRRAKYWIAQARQQKVTLLLHRLNWACGSILGKM